MKAVFKAAIALAIGSVAMQGCAVEESAESPGTVATVDSGFVAAPGTPAAVPVSGGDTAALAPPDMPVSSPATGTIPPASGRATGGAPSAGASQPGAPSQGSVEAVVQQAVRAYESARTARGTFEQSLNNPQTGTRSTARGEFFRAQPDKFAFRFSDPQGDAIIADGTHVWLYLPSSNPGQVIRAPLTPSATGAFDLGAMFFERPLERYTIVDRGTTPLDGRPVRALRLTPKQRGGPFTTATVWLDADGTLRQFNVVDGQGLERTVRITTYTANAAVNPSVFRFTPPEGVRVVDAPAIGQ